MKRIRLPFFVLTILFFVIAFLERVAFDLGPNVELVTLVMLLASVYLGKQKALGLVFAVMLASDLVLGNTKIFIFTWSGFMIPVFVVNYLVGKFGSINKVILGTGMGIGANLFFYGWTNFGVWFLDGWGMYANDLGGLIQCYVNGLPFLKLQLTSTLLFVPLGFGLWELVSGFSLLWQGRRPYNWIE